MTIDDLRGWNTAAALRACNDLDSATRRSMIAQCSPGDDRPLFALRVAEDLIMPSDLSRGLTGVSSNLGRGGSIGDFGEGRMYILKYFASHPNDPRVARAKAAAWSTWFYPEYKNIANVRDRFTKIAEDHVWLDAPDLMQITLFSLNGFLDWTAASHSSAIGHGGKGTTCGLFVRACRAAAHILERRDWPFNTPSGTDPCITGPGTTSAVSPNSGREPKKGDIFHVSTPPQYNDHVGVILSHATDEGGTWLWKTAEGGQGKCCETRYFPDRKIVLENGVRYHGDPPYKRALQKWIDIEALDKAVNP